MQNPDSENSGAEQDRNEQLEKLRQYLENKDPAVISTFINLSKLTYDITNNTNNHTNSPFTITDGYKDHSEMTREDVIKALAEIGDIEKYYIEKGWLQKEAARNGEDNHIAK